MRGSMYMQMNPASTHSLSSEIHTSDFVLKWVPSIEKQCISPIDFWKIAKKNKICVQQRILTLRLHVLSIKIIFTN